MPPKWIHRQPHARRQGPAGAMLLQPGLRQGEQPPMGPWLVSSVGAHGPAEHGIPLCHQVGSRRDAPRERRARPVPSPPPPRGPSPRGKADTRGPLPLPFRLYKAGSAVPPPRPRGPGPAAFFCLLWAEPGRAGRDGAGGTAPGARCPPAPKGRAAGRAPAEQRPPPCSNPAPVQVRRLRRGPGPAAPRSARWDRRERGGQPRGGTGRDGAGTAPMDRAGWSRGQLGGEAVGREEAAAPGRAGGSSPGRPPTVAVLELVLGRARGGGDERQERPRCVPASPPSARAGGGSPSPGRGRDVSARGGEEWS